MTVRLPALLLVLAAVPVASSGEEPPALREALPGGLELAVVPVRGAESASLRCVVRAGSAQDPPGKEGLAHALEHLLLQAPGADGLDLLQAASAGGAYLNAHTSRDATTYVLDAPADTFLALGERLLRSITSPDLAHADVDRELAVISREDEYRGESSTAIGLVEDAVFRSRAVEVGTIGSSPSRERITARELSAFHGAHYARANTAIVLSGAVTAAEGRALVERAVLLPHTAGAPALARPVSPELPITEQIRSPFMAAVLGYRLDPEDRPACRPLAELLEQRLVVEMTVRRSLARRVWAVCTSLRDADFVLALAHVPSIEAVDLPARMDEVFRSVTTLPADAGEQRTLELRMGRIDDRIRSAPAAFAGWLAESAERPGELVHAPLPGAGAGRFPARGVRELARRTFRPERRVLVQLSPFEG